MCEVSNRPPLLLQALSQIPVLVQRRHRLVSARAAERSTAAQDQALPQGGLPQVFAGQLLGAAVEHLYAWYVLAGADASPRFAHLTLLRSALEPAVTARWLLRGETGSARICRGLALVNESGIEWRKIEDAFLRAHPGQQRTTTIEDEIERVRAECDCIRPTALPPTIIDRVGSFALGQNGVWFYRVLSALAHGTIIGASAGVMSEAIGVNVAGATLRRVGFDPVFAANATGLVSRTTAAALTDMERYLSNGT